MAEYDANSDTYQAHTPRPIRQSPPPTETRTLIVCESSASGQPAFSRRSWPGKRFEPILEHPGFNFVSVFDGEDWDPDYCEPRAQSLLWNNPSSGFVVCVGRTVASAFRLPPTTYLRWFPSKVTPSMKARAFCVVPHPSSKNTWWDSKSNKIAWDYFLETLEEL